MFPYIYIEETQDKQVARGSMLFVLHDYSDKSSTIMLVIEHESIYQPEQSLAC